MVQDARYIDLQRTYIPMDPNSFPTVVTLASAGNASEEGQSAGGRTPIMPYDGYNFMPTAQGYSSFFGTNSTLGINALTGNVDDVFIVQKNTFENIAIALKDDGIWTKDLGSGGAWTQSVVLTVPGTHALWSRCVIDSELYLYRAGHTHYYQYGPATAYAFTAVAPSFLVMAAQRGIFKAGGRLGFWDTANSISWSAFTNLADFTPSTSSLAGNTIFQDIVGKIVNILSHGEGFIVYSTRSIIAVRRNIDSPMLWDPKVIFNQNGISYREEVCQADPDTIHFANTHHGLVEIGAEGNAEFVIPEISRYLSERNSPIYLQFINGKYLFLKYLDADFNIQRVNFEAVAFDEGLYTFEQISDFIADTSVPDKAISAAELAHRQKYIYDTLGFSAFADASTPASVPILSDYLSSLIPLSELAAYAAVGDYTYFDLKADWATWTFPDNVARGIVKVSDAVSSQTIPPSQNYQIEANANNFYRRQEMLWDLERRYTADWKRWSAERIVSLGPISGTRSNKNRVVANTTPVGTGALRTRQARTTINNLNLGFIDFEVEGNKYYGVSPKGLWLQRSILSRIDYGWSVDCFANSTGTTFEALWYPAANFAESEAHGAEVDYNTTRAAWASGFATAFRSCWEIAITSLGVSPTFANVGALVAETAANLISLYSYTTANLTIHQDLGQTDTFNYFNIATGAPEVLVDVRRIIIRCDLVTLVSPFTAIFYVFLRPTKVAHPVTGDFLDRNIEHNYPKYPLAPGAVYYAESANITETISALVPYELARPNCFNKELGYTRVTGHGHYSGLSFIVDDSTPEAVDYTDICLPSPPPSNPNGVSYRGTDLTIAPYFGGTLYGLSSTVIIDGVSYTHPDDPGSSGGSAAAAALTPPVPTGTVLYQIGSIEPVYPTFVGSFVLDTHLKKWGKLKFEFKNLFDGYPVNTMAGKGIFPYEHFLPKMMARVAAGTFPIFDAYPADSEICYGKAGYYRKGFTDLEQVIIHHRTPRTGVLRVEFTFDSRNPEDFHAVEKAFVNTALINEGFNVSGRWYNIVVRGHYDLTHLELITVRAGKR